MKTIEAIYGVPTEEPVVQLFLADGGQFGEIRQSATRLELELWTPDGHSSIEVDADELCQAIAVAKSRLT